MTGRNWAFATALLLLLIAYVAYAGWWNNTHNPVIQAMNLSLALLQEEGAKYDELCEHMREKDLDRFELQFGRKARDRLDARERRYEATGRQ
jgi:hypothetical protein